MRAVSLPLNIFYLLCEFERIFIANSLVPPDMALYPPWVHAFKYENESYQVKCIGSEDLLWKKNDNQITNTEFNVHTRKANDSPPGLLLIFKRIRKDDGGEYTCWAKIGNRKTAKGSFDLQVIKPVNFDQPETTIEMREGESKRLDCSADGEPKPDVVWYFGSQVIQERKLDTYDHYYIRNATWRNAGVYTCQAFQNILQTRNAEKLFHVKVIHKPNLITSDKQPSKLYGFVNQVLNITCEVTAEPKAYFIWYKNNTAINPKKHQNKISMINTDNKSIMQIPLDGSERYGEYRCDATNELGFLIQTFWVNVTNKPLVPQVVIKKVLSQEVNIKIGSSKDTKFYRIQYTEHTYCNKGEKWINSNITEQENKKENETYTIGKLEPNTKYILRVTSINEGGTSDYSPEYLFQTSKYVSSSETVLCCNIYLFIYFLVFIVY